MTTTLDVALGRLRLQANSGVPAIKRQAQLVLALDATLSPAAGADEASSALAYALALLKTLSELVGTPEQAHETLSSSGAGGGERRDLAVSSLYLLAVVSPHLAPGDLRNKAQRILAICAPLFALLHDDAPALKSLLDISSCAIGSLAQAQLASTTSSSVVLSARTCFGAALDLCADSRPKVRRKALDDVLRVLTSTSSDGAGEGGKRHPFARDTARWAVKALLHAQRQLKDAGRRHGKKSAQAQTKEGETAQQESHVLAIVNFVAALGPAWDDSVTPELLPVLLSLLPLHSSPHLPAAVLTLIASLFSASHADASLSSDVVRSTLGALLDAQPKLPSREHQLDDKQEKILAGWLESAGEGLVALARVNAQEALPRARALFIELTPVLAHARLPATRQSAEQALRLMVRHCISDDAIKSCVKSRKVQKGSEVATIVRALTDAMHEPVYAGAALAHLLNLAASIFQRLQLRVTSVDGAYDTLRPAATHHSLLAALLRRAADLRESEWRANADAVTKAAVAICGPQWVLDILPLGLGPEGPPHGETNARAWLLPLLRDSVHNTQLAHFKLEFVPLLGHFNARREQALSAPTQTEAVKVEGRVYQTLLAQVWELLPAYCQFATDVAAQFDTAFVQQLAGVIYEPPEPAIRSAAVKALHNVVESNARICDSLAPRDVLVDQFGFAQDEAREARQELKSLATAVLGIGFNVYGTLVRGQGQHVLDAMGAWLELLDPAQRAQTLERVMLLLSDTLAKNPEPQGEQNSKSIPQSHALFDILVMSTAHLGPDPLLPRKMLTDMCLADAVLKSRDQGVQKKSYRMMTRLVEHTRGAVVASDVGDVIERLCDDKVIVGNAAKRDRLALLLELVPLLPRDRLHHVPTIIPEAVLGTKEANEKTRECAFDLLVAIGVKMQQGGSVERAKIKWMQKDPADAADDDAEMEEDEEQPAIAEATVEEYLTMIAAGLSGKNAHMISASITALSRLLFEFHETLTDEALEALVETLFGFLESPNREIARSAVSFVKVAIVTLSDSVIHPTLPTLVPNLLRWSREHANHFKIKVRHIVERLIRRFGFDDVEREVPETDKKLVQNIRKRQMRSKRKKAAAAATREDEEAEAEAKEDLPKSQAGPRSAFDEVLYGSESESDSDDDEDSEDDERARGRSKHRAGGASRAGKSRGRGKDETRGDERYLYEDEGEVLDLLDDKQMSRISAARPSGKGERKALDSRFKKDKEGRYKFTEDKGEPAVEHPATSSSAFVDAFTNKDGHRLDAKGRARFNKTQGKRGRGDDDDDDDDDVVNDLSELNVGGGKRKKQRTARAEPQRLGAEFKAKRAGGDVKKAGGPAPYAYLPLANVPSSSKKRRGPPPAKVAITGHKRSGKKA